MNIVRCLKLFTERMPYSVGRWLAKIPFGWRLPGYRRLKDECKCSQRWGSEDGDRYALEQFARIFEFARENFPCYRELYRRAGVLDLTIRSFEDIRKVPVIDKAWTKAHVDEFKGVYRLNTGGSSGQPTPFWMDRNCWKREWAHMHTIWESIGYDWHDLKLAIRGKNLGARPFVYNPVHNEFIINAYLKVGDYGDRLLGLFRRRKIRWFHGYPSSIYQFLLEMEEAFGVEMTRAVLKDVKGLLLSSEYPHPNQVEKFRAYGLRFVSWYGHSEMAVLANGGEDLTYRPFVTYGLAEVVDGHLIGTSYHNTAMPLIRYDTGDEVKETVRSPGGRCEAFAVTSGRSGDYLEDKNRKRIPITSFVFGRHHRAFDVADYVQLSQSKPGKCTLYVVSDKPLEEDLRSLFDLSGIDMDFEVSHLDKPVRTAAGKLKLRI